MSASPGLFVKAPGRDFTRERKLFFETTLRLLLGMGGGSLQAERCCNVERLTAEHATLQGELEVATSLMQRHISANAHSALDQVEYQRQYDEYAPRFEAIRSRTREVSAQREALISKRGRIQSYLDTLKNQGLITVFDEVLWYGTVDQVRVTQDGLCALFSKMALRQMHFNYHAVKTVSRICLSFIFTQFKL